ncbi:hypothetical protein SBA4_7430002 [Candidatus Sulfopaludibacter sp. SbA4]|nr:hypothetical protein SBA4_7430002 [Candidatus Sulfopaludibacter sp. SbA4]
MGVDEYLNTSFRPDMEYVDGVLVERGMPTIAHSVLQMILIYYFAQYRRAFSLSAAARGPDPDRRTGPISHPGRDAMPHAPSGRQGSELGAVGGCRDPVA